MKLDELERMIAEGDTAAKLAEAIGQRMVRVPEGWDWQTQAGVCACGLLTVTLPRAVRLERVVVLNGQALRTYYDLRQAHVADEHGRAVCPECVEEETPCEGHEAVMCDTPDAELCAACMDEAAMPGQDRCVACVPREPEWDKDRYLGL